MTKYQKRISGPLLGRIDIHSEVSAVEYEKLSDKRLGEPSECVRARVEGAREIQRSQFAGLKEVANLPLPATPTCVQPKCASSSTWTKPAAA